MAVPRYPITAYAACCALGMTSDEVLPALYGGRSGLARALPSEARQPLLAALGPLPASLPQLPAILHGFDSRLARMAALMFDSMHGAVARAVRVHGADRVGLVLGSSTGGLAATEQAYVQRSTTGTLPESYDFDRTHAFHALIDVLRGLSGARGPGYVVSSACSSGNKVFGSAQRLLAAGWVDAVLVGAVDTLCEITVRGFHSLGVLSQEPCRPFAHLRDGTSLGEGGALLLLERQGTGRAALCGVGEACDAHHMTQPAPDGSGAIAAMRAALEDAGLTAADIDHVNAHGTGTPLNDAAEARALEVVFGRSVPVAATKAATGHLLGAAAALEAVFAIAAIERGQLPPSLNTTPRDPSIALDIVQAPRTLACQYVLSNAFAFGGSNACVIFGANA